MIDMHSTVHKETAYDHEQPQTARQIGICCTDVTWGRVRCYISKSKETHPLVKDVTADPSPCHICKQNDESEFVRVTMVRTAERHKTVPYE